MMSLVRAGWTLTLLASAAVLVACGTDGETPSCERYPAPYDIRVEHRRLAAWTELASTDGCGTLPVGFTLGGAGGTGGAPVVADAGEGGTAEPETGEGGAAGSAT